MKLKWFAVTTIWRKTNPTPPNGEVDVSIKSRMQFVNATSSEDAFGISYDYYTKYDEDIQDHDLATKIVAEAPNQ